MCKLVTFSAAQNCGRTPCMLPKEPVLFTYLPNYDIEWEKDPISWWSVISFRNFRSGCSASQHWSNSITAWYHCHSCSFAILLNQGFVTQYPNYYFHQQTAMGWQTCFLSKNHFFHACIGIRVRISYKRPCTKWHSNFSACNNHEFTYEPISLPIIQHDHLRRKYTATWMNHIRF